MHQCSNDQIQSIKQTRFKDESNAKFYRKQQLIHYNDLIIKSRL